MVRSGADGVRFTLDSNILIYSADRRAGARHALARDIVASSARTGAVLTLQSLSEFYSVSTRKGMLRHGLAAALVERWLTVFPCVALTPNAVRTALSEAGAGRASYWDALLVATAAEAGCGLIFTEDMQHGGNLHGVEIHNPFDPVGGLTLRAKQLLGL